MTDRPKMIVRALAERYAALAELSPALDREASAIMKRLEEENEKLSALKLELSAYVDKSHPRMLVWVSPYRYVLVRYIPSHAGPFATVEVLDEER